MSGTGRYWRAAGRALVATWWLCAAAPGTRAQSTGPALKALVEEISVDSMRQNLERLTGLRPVTIHGPAETAEGGLLRDTVWTITTRAAASNDVPAHFLRDRLEAFGIPVRFHEVESAKPDTGNPIRNVIARIEGATEPETAILVGAHYDAVGGSPGADDNGSGTVAVLEMARILARRRPDRTILFAFWDAEETGLDGSTAYAMEAFAREDDMAAVVNLDMIGWNEGEPTMLVAAYSTASQWLVDLVIALRDTLGLTVEPVAGIMGRSDHVPFAIRGWPSVLVIEHFGEDFNPYYHSSQDRIEHIDWDYASELARLALAAVVSVAFDAETLLSDEEIPSDAILSVSAYPNPATGQVEFAVQGVDPHHVQVELFDALGRRVATGSGTKLDVRHVADGVYGYRLASGGEARTGTVVIRH